MRIRIIMTLAGLLGFAVFGGFAWWAKEASSQWRAWMPVEATILEARIVGSDRLRGGVSYTYYEPFVRYTYEVAGTRYESTRLAGSTSRSTSYDEAAGQIEGYEAGSTVTAHVNPKDPGDALLRPEMSPLLIPAFAVAAIVWLLLWGGLGWILGRS